MLIVCGQGWWEPPAHIAGRLSVTGGMDRSFIHRTNTHMKHTGLLFTIQITVYVLFSFCAGQIAHKVGRWRAVLVSTLLWSAGALVWTRCCWGRDETGLTETYTYVYVQACSSSGRTRRWTRTSTGARPGRPSS